MTPAIDIAARIDLLLPQYDGAVRFRALLSGIIDMLQTEVVDPLLALDRGLNPDVSSGVVLDWIGVRLDFARPAVRSQDARYYGMAGTGPSLAAPARIGRTFDQAPFFSQRARIEDVEPLGDRRYRTLLKARARRLRGSASREVIEENLAILFGDGYLDETGTDLVARIPADADVVVRRIVVGTNTTPARMDALIPRPAGRSMTIGDIP